MYSLRLACVLVPVLCVGDGSIVEASLLELTNRVVERMSPRPTQSMTAMLACLRREPAACVSDPVMQVTFHPHAEKAMVLVGT